MQTNPSLKQREHGDSIILPSDRIVVIVRARYYACEEEEALGIISNNIN